MVSPSLDGRLLKSALSGMGYHFIMGSSSSFGTSALRNIIRSYQREPFNMGISPDGPKGPPRKIKPGLFYLSKILTARIVPLSVACRKKWILSSWDSFEIPLPFATIVLYIGESLGNHDLCSEEDAKSILENRMVSNDQKAKAALGIS